jgi:hypothetical protein
VRFTKPILIALVLIFPFLQESSAAELAGFDIRNGTQSNIDRAISYGYKCRERVIAEEYKEIHCTKRTGRVDDDLNYISFGDMGINIGCGVIALCHLQDFDALQFMLRQENNIVRQAPEHRNYRTWMCWETAAQNIICLTAVSEEYEPGWTVQLYNAKN